MNLVEWDKFNRWAYYMFMRGYVIVGFQLEPFLTNIVIGTKKEKEKTKEAEE